MLDIKWIKTVRGPETLGHLINTEMRSQKRVKDGHCSLTWYNHKRAVTIH